MNKKQFRRLLGSRIREIRTIHNMSQDALAAKVGMARTSIVHIEHGKQGIDAHKLVLVANALGILPKKLLATEEEWIDEIRIITKGED